ncbi:MAG: HAMP domain-containing histidine kinase [Elusimicrobia bacterium]|nr:HAMP domain-containing histidine kinase [Elusimicrobiota bacterium]
MELLLLLVPAVLLVLMLSLMVFYQVSGIGQQNSAGAREQMNARLIDNFVRSLAVAENTIYSKNAALNDMAARLTLSNEQLVQLNSMKSKFLSMVVHDVRTPLASIRGFSELFAVQPSATERQKNMSKQMNIAVDRLNRLVSDLTDLAMIEAGKLKISPAVFNFYMIIEELLPQMETLAHNQGVELKYDQVNRNALVNGDKFRLSQVLQNLLGNAIKFTPKEGLVELKTRAEGRWLYAYVKDSGAGIHPSETRKIFEKFYQAKHQKNEQLRKMGWGLGLAIAQEIVVQHKGVIAAESKGLGHGSTFWFKIPVESILRDEEFFEKPEKPKNH